MKTALWETHRALGAKMVVFGGWEMPVSYKGIIEEHLTVRQRVGLFDVSHMGRVLVIGPDAEKFLDYLATNIITGKSDGTATYTVLASEKGGCVDDVIIYRESTNEFFLIVNASNRQKDLEHLNRYAAPFDVQIQDRYQQDGILAIQGPKAEPLVSSFFKEAENLKPMHFISVNFQGEKIILSRTGYTGAGGYEIYAPQSIVVDLWHRFFENGQPYGLEPIGLGARDTLRLEMGYALYGHELAEDIAPIESVSAWTVKWNKPNFLGRSAIEQLKDSPEKRSEYGIVLKDKGIAREGYPVFKNDQEIGRVTSGTFSPSLQQAIAIILVKGKLSLGDQVDVQIRQNKIQAKIVALPFI